MSKYAIGLDFGTNSCRALIIDLLDGKDVALSKCDYPSGDNGILTDRSNPAVARQNPGDYTEAMTIAVRNAVDKAKAGHGEFTASEIISIGVCATSSSILPVDKECIPLCFHEKFKDNINAMVWLWKDHSSYEEAEKITRLAMKQYPEYLSRTGGAYSSEWFWSKILRCINIDPKVFAAAFSFLELCDYIPAILAGISDPMEIKRGVCAAGHKAMYNQNWGGLPSPEFLASLNPALPGLRDRLYKRAYPSDQIAGHLSKVWAGKLGLSENVTISVGCIDAHAGAVGAGIKQGVMVKMLGTSTCDLMIWPKNREIADIPGVSGIVPDSIIPGFFGIEAGQAAVGDIFLWFVKHLTPDTYGPTVEAKFKNLELKASALKPGESGLLALDWNNGNRSLLMDPRLSGLLIGQTLHTEAHEIYRTLIEATAFGALKIIKRFEEYGLSIDKIVICGGLAVKSSMLSRIYADVCGKEMMLTNSEQTGALGASILGAVSAGEDAGGFSSVQKAQEKMTGIKKVFSPDAGNTMVYNRLFDLYEQLYDSFGTGGQNNKLNLIMKELMVLSEEQKRG